MVKQHKKESKSHLIFRHIMMLIGATLAAIAIELFLVPNNIIDGGIIGISLLVNYLTNLSFGILIFIFNIPFLVPAIVISAKTSLSHLCLVLLH